MPLSQSTLQQINEFVHAELIPKEPAFLTTSFEELLPLLQTLRAEVKAQGWWAPHMPEAYGGMGLTLTELARVGMVLGQTPIGHYCFGFQAPDAGNMEILKDFGTAEQKERYLQPLVNGEIRSCFSMTEPEFAGSNPVNMGTMAVKDGDDYVITHIHQNTPT